MHIYEEKRIFYTFKTWFFVVLADAKYRILHLGVVEN